MEEAAPGGDAVERGMDLPVHSPGPLPWSQVSEPAVDTGAYTNRQSLSWIPNFSEDDFTSGSWSLGCWLCERRRHIVCICGCVRPSPLSMVRSCCGVCVCVRVCQYITLDTRVFLVVGCCCNIIGFASQVHNLLSSLIHHLAQVTAMCL